MSVLELVLVSGLLCASSIVACEGQVLHERPMLSQGSMAAHALELKAGTNMHLPMESANVAR